MASIAALEPLNTWVYMIAGYTVIFSVMLGYVISLVVRTRRLQQEKSLLETLEKK